MPFKFRLFFSGLNTADLESLTNVGWSSYRPQGEVEGGKFCRKHTISFLYAHLKLLLMMEICLNHPRKFWAPLVQITALCLFYDALMLMVECSR